MFYDGFPPYVPVAKRREQAQKKLAQLKKQGKKANPVVVEGRLIATTFWGKAWCDNLETYSDFSSRLPRGRSYVRNGSVIDLQITAGQINALVSGSQVYRAHINIQPLQKLRWETLTQECSGKIDSLVELLTGKLSDGVMKVLCRKEGGLFPTAKEISIVCSCPDGAVLCKHLAATFYGIGARLDLEPELLFILRGVDKMDLVRSASASARVGNRVKNASTLNKENLAVIFGIEMDEGQPPPLPVSASVAKKNAQKKPVPRNRVARGKR